MEQKFYAGRHVVCIMAMTVLSNTVSHFSASGDNRQKLVAFLIAFAISFVIILAVAPVSFKLFRAGSLREINSGVKKTLLGTVYALTALAAIGIASISTWRFVNFTAKFILPHGSQYLITLTFAVVLLLLSYHDKWTIAKLSVILFPIAAVTIIVLFILLLRQMNLDLLISYREMSMKNTLFQSVNFYLLSFGQSLLIIVFSCMFCFKKGSGLKSLMIGNLIGGVLLLVCFLSVLLLFGSELYDMLEFRYTYAVNTISIGPVFTRMDALTYVISFFSSVLKISAAIHIVKMLAQKFSEKATKYAPFVSVAVILVLAILFGKG